MNKTRITLSINELEMLINSMEAEFTDYMTEGELSEHDKLYARLVKIAQRIND